MSRDNRRNTVRRRSRHTGEAHQTAHQTMPHAGDGPPWILDAQTLDQQHVESAILHRLLGGARSDWLEGSRPKHPLFVESVSPSADGLKLVVPAGKAEAFGAALTGGLIKGALLLGDEISIRHIRGTGLHITAAGAVSGLVEVRCAWPPLRTAVDGLPGIVVSSAEARFSSAEPRPSQDERAVLSGLLRRIALFADPGALDWLFAWHHWLIRGRRAPQPQPPERLLTDLIDEGLGLGPLPRRTLGLDGQARRRTVAGTTPRLKSAKAKRPAAPTRPTAFPGAESFAADTGQAQPASGRYRHLAVTAFRLNSDVPIRREFYVMRFPAGWMSILAELEKPTGVRGLGYEAIAQLNEAIAAVLPECVVTQRRGDREHPHWLLATSRLSTETIFRLVLAWVRSQPASDDQIQAVLAQLHLSDLTWEPVRIAVDLPFELLAKLVSVDVAERLSQPSVPVPFANLRFVRCSDARGAEVMSWPPQGTGPMSFSVTIKISVHTRPFTTEPSVHLDFGIRRWMPVRGEFTAGRAHPVYVAVDPTAADWPGMRGSFGIAHITPGRDVEGRWQAQWSPTLIRILTEADLLHLLPDAEDLVADPIWWLNQPSPAALTYRAAVLKWHRVSDGLPVIDRARLMDWATEELTPRLTPIPPLPRAEAKVYPGLTREADTPIPAAALAAAVGPHLTIELRSQTPSGLQHAVSRLEQLLGVELPHIAGLPPSETTVGLGPVTVTVRSILASNAPAGLVPGRPRAAATAYAQQITLGLDPAAHPTASLLETALEDVPGASPGDVKAALRRALAATGRLSGFVYPAGPAETAQPRNVARLRHAVDDLFVQLGVRPAHLPAPAPQAVNCRPALLGIWTIRRSKADRRRVHPQVPIAVLIDPTGHHVQIRTTWSSWQPLHVGLVDLAQHYGNAATAPGIDPVQFIKESVEQAIASHPDTLLLTHAQNLRSTWPALADPEMDVDTIDLGRGPQPIKELPGLRHIWVRSAHGAGTPQSYGVNHATIGHPKGMWRFPEPRLFASTSGKPAYAMASMRGNSKIAADLPYGSDGVTRLDVQAPVWNEQLLELAVAGLQGGDQPEQWAAMAHNLRDAAPYTGWTTPLPWPLQLAQQVEEYFQPR